MSRKFFGFAAMLAALVTMGQGCITFGGTAQGPMGVFRSDDKGETWQGVMSWPTTQGVKSIAGLKAYRLFPDPSDPNTHYLGTRGQGLFYTYNNGESWQMSEALGARYIYGVAVDPKDKCVLYVTDGPHIYKTVDCGRTWQLSYTEQRTNQRLVSVAVDPERSDIIYGAILGGDILMSGDAGRSWRVVKRFGFDIQQLSVDPLSPGRVYVASYQDGLFRSDNRGGDWVDVTEGLDLFSGSRQFYRLSLHPSKRNSLFWVSKYGILRSDDAGVSWSDLKLITPPGSVNIYSFAVNPKNENELYYTGTLLGDKNVHLRSTFYKTVDGGKNWVTKKLPTNTIPISIEVHATNPATLLTAFTVADN